MAGLEDGIRVTAGRQSERLLKDYSPILTDNAPAERPWGRSLLHKRDAHTLRRLPTGLFYARG